MFDLICVGVEIMDGSLKLTQLPLETYDVSVGSIGQAEEKQVIATSPSSSEIRIGLSMPIMGPILAVIAIIASATQAYKIELTL